MFYAEISHAITRAFGDHRMTTLRSEDQRFSGAISAGLSIDIAYSQNQLGEGITSFSTIGLSDYPMVGKSGREFGVRLELASASYLYEPGLDLALAMTSFYVMQRGWLCTPGKVIRKVVQMCGVSERLPHLYLNAPFLWEDTLPALDVNGTHIAWLLAIPISDAEANFRTSHSDSALEHLFEINQVDIFDLSRDSVL